MPTTREQILDATIELLRDGRNVSLDAVAADVGLTKAGLIHHFRFKQDLMLGVIEHVADRWIEALQAEVGDAAGASATSRIGAYARLALQRQHDEADIAMLADTRLRGALTERWVEQMRPWIQLDDVPPGPERAALTTVRLIADGVWFDDAANVFPVDLADRPAIQALIDILLERSLP
ncbi:TetR/AcrR family transcriptional regulator [Knoellia sp. LjRoot47]|uniref:TetR/AcrR family transcriptional regulator n=1 Tax=Knoellia sp. LjRoot47 TaxID=3342330 RepID=UPI003ECEB329